MEEEEVKEGEAEKRRDKRELEGNYESEEGREVRKRGERREGEKKTNGRPGREREEA